MITPVRRALAGALALSLTLSGAAAQGESAERVPPAALNTDEAGLWMIFEQAERDIARSPLLIKDKALNDYVRGVLCKVTPRCGEMRIYILDLPLFNASMAPNGMMHVWSGMLLRVENEAQLAFVLGHEFKHYSAKHSLERFRSIRDTSNVLAFFSLIAAGAGAGYVGTLAQLAALGALFSYSRDQEREADAGGLEALAAAGYDGRSAPAIWDALIEEQKANKDRDERSLFTATHPSPEERLKTLRAAAERAPVHGITGEETLRAAVRPHRIAWFEGELSRGEYDESLVVINRHLRVEPSSGDLLYFQGEAYRRRAGDGDLERARDSYSKAIASGTAIPQVYRGLGLVLLKLGDKAGAKQAFITYLQRAPAADDRAMIEFYLRSL